MFLVSVIGYFLPSKAEGFDSLADLIASYALITRDTYFVFVPGPSRPDRQLCPSAETAPLLVHHPAAIRGLKSTPDEQPVPAEVLQAGCGRVQGRPDVGHAPELWLRELKPDVRTKI